MAKASLTRVELRDPYKIFHKMTAAELQALTPSFDWNAYLEAIGRARARKRSTSPSRSSLRSSKSLLKTEPLANWKTYFRWQVVAAAMRLICPRRS